MLNDLLYCFWAIPTWLLTNLITQFLPKTHEWHKRHFTLHDWAHGRTDLTMKFDSVLWGLLLWIPIFIAI